MPLRVLRPRWILGMAGGLIVTLALFWLFASALSGTPGGRMTRARAALEGQDYATAESLALAVPRADPLWLESRLLAGEAAMRAGRFDLAAGHFRAVPRDASPGSLSAALSLGEVLRETGHLSSAAGEYQFVLQHRPEHAQAHERMAFVLGTSAQRWESQPHLMALVRTGAAKVEDLIVLGDLERPLERGDYLRKCAKTRPDDPLVQLGLAAIVALEGDPASARRQLERVIAKAPHLVAAHALLGDLLLEADGPAFARWNAGLPAEAKQSPDVWLVRGLWLRREGKLREAARCFWEAVRLAPTHRRGTYQLGQVLLLLKEPIGDEFSRRSRLLFELTHALDLVLKSNAGEASEVERVVRLLEEHGRIWEAWAWASLASDRFPFASWPAAVIARTAPQLEDQPPQTLDAHNLALRFDLSGYPDPARLLAVETAPQEPGSPSERPRIRFVEEPNAGIDFVYDNADDPLTPGMRMQEQTGGGVAVLDVDGDLLPDLYFSQGGTWRAGELEPTASPDKVDRLFRQQSGRYVDVTRKAALVDGGFGQGPAVGDFDNDGFPDLYVGHIGRNQLLRNNGDGTFSDVTATARIQGTGWTASTLMADLNADGVPDLFDVTYLTGGQVFEALCDGRSCSPNVFLGPSDRLHIGQGDGTFRTVSDADPSTTSKGLGVVAADLERNNRPSLFVSNDQVPNAFLRNRPADNQFNIRLTDDAYLSGLAYGAGGLAMAGMGIAADDADGDGRLDFFVTTFKDEARGLFLQQSEGVFVESVATAGLRAPCWPYVGWGTQFLDADRDGAPDLVMTNGHVDDFRASGGTYQMRPQFFRNTGGARFVELLPEQAGRYFAKKFLGRGLSRLDWNADGLMDFVVSNMNDPASLVTNVTEGAGRYVNVRLHATRTARDAIGAVVEVICGNRRWIKQLVAGDGYMASNERVLQFGLGKARKIDSFRVTWPSGQQTLLNEVPLDCTVEIVEGVPGALLWRESGLEEATSPDLPFGETE